MRFHILTLFPEMVENGLRTSILGRACQKGILDIHAVNIRDFTLDRHGRVDDYPYGGGAGMLMQAQPIYDAYRAVASACRSKRPIRVIYTTPQGRIFDQKMARELAQEEELIFLCGHYEGVDERVLEEIVTDQVSLGDYVLTGGELPAMVMIDAISRMVPGVLKNEESGETESFGDGLLEYPQYTRPEEWRGRQVPGVLLSGDHGRVEKWRQERSLERTRLRRPDLYARYDLPGKALEYLRQDRLGHTDMIENIRRRQAQVVAASESGVLLWNPKSSVYLLSARDRDAGERLLSLTKPDGAIYCCHRRFLAESVAGRFGRETVRECCQAVYSRKTPLPEPEDVAVRPLDGTELEGALPRHFASVHGEDPDCLLREERLFGVFPADGDEGPVGVFGLCLDGRIGMPQVLAPYRRRGIGQALLRFGINRTLEMGWTPYAQMGTDDMPSLTLAEAAGMRICREKLYWI